MTHYGPSPPQPDPTILGLAGDGNKVVLWLKNASESELLGKTEMRLEKELTAHEAIDLARRLLIEATPLLKRGV
jgi:hypothetical protein